MQTLEYGKSPRPSRMMWRASVPVFVAVLAWPFFVFLLGYIGVLFAFGTLILCFTWAIPQSKEISISMATAYPNLTAKKLRRRILLLQVFGIFGTYPAFVLLLKILHIH